MPPTTAGDDCRCRSCCRGDPKEWCMKYSNNDIWNYNTFDYVDNDCGRDENDKPRRYDTIDGRVVDQPDTKPRRSRRLTSTPRSARSPREHRRTTENKSTVPRPKKSRKSPGSPVSTTPPRKHSNKTKKGASKANKPIELKTKDTLKSIAVEFSQWRLDLEAKELAEQFKAEQEFQSAEIAKLRQTIRDLKQTSTARQTVPIEVKIETQIKETPASKPALKPATEEQLVAVIDSPQDVPKEQPDKLCKICLDHDQCIAFAPCGHLATCNECSNQCVECPICRAVIMTRLRVFAT
jgi:hypothetical protein